MIEYKDICKACSKLDVLSEHNSLESILRLHGVQEVGAVRAAEQRALRAYFLLHKRQQIPDGIIKLPYEDRELFSEFQAIWMDGFTSGLAVGIER